MSKTKIAEYAILRREIAQLEAQGARADKAWLTRCRAERRAVWATLTEEERAVAISTRPGDGG